MEKHVIILTRGIQGSGKSTWAKQWVQVDPLNRIRYNNDDIRLSQGVYWPEDNKALTKKEKTVKSIKNFAVFTYMENGYDIVIDNMNLNPKEVNYWQSNIEQFNNLHKDIEYHLEFKDFFIPVEECIARDAQRSNPIGASIIKKTYRQYRSLIIDIETKKLLDNQIPVNDVLPNCIIADMDATICFNVTQRPFFGNGAADKMMEDVPNKPIIKLINNYLKCASENDRIFIITGRENTPAIHEATLNYIKKYVSEDERIILLMRNLNDHSSGDICKKYIYETFIKDKYNVDFVLDDSNKIVKMYRELGLTVLQPNEGKF